MAALFSSIACSGNESIEEISPVTTDMGKTLVIYYSYTGNCQQIVDELTRQIEADVLEIQPAEKGLKYEANNYALGTELLNAIQANPNDASSYPAIDPVTTSLSNYRNIIVVTPLWWSQMAAIMQTYLFNYGPQMTGKNVGLIVSSASSGINGVVTDARRLVPDATWMSDALWINNSNRSRTASLLSQWLANLNFQSSTEISKMYISIDGQTQPVTLADTEAAQELASRLQNGPVSVTLSSSGGFEIWGPLGFSLPDSDRQITAQPGDVVLYNSSNICIFYGSNSWSYTRLGKIDGLSENELRTFLKAGQSSISVTLSLNGESSALQQVRSTTAPEVTYSLNGQRVTNPTDGIYIQNGKKVNM